MSTNLKDSLRNHFLQKTHSGYLWGRLLSELSQKLL